jgi:hypothetical protein
MTIKVLHIHDCPSWQHARRNLGEALAHLGIEENVETVEITTTSQSLAEDFGGSPTITHDGRDIFGHPDDVTDLACRIYFTPEGLKGVPSTDMIVSALKKLTLR